MKRLFDLSVQANSLRGVDIIFEGSDFANSAILCLEMVKFYGATKAVNFLDLHDRRPFKVVLQRSN